MVLEELKSSMDSADTRYCVIDYVNHRLTVRGYQWSHCPPLMDPPQKLQVLMREKGDDFEERYQAQFQDLVEQLHITQNTAYSMFKSIVEELFSGGINWGRIVALFAFGGSLAVRCVETGMPNLVESVVEWITIYIEQHLQTWIIQHGGWFELTFTKMNAVNSRNLAADYINYRLQKHGFSWENRPSIENQNNGLPVCQAIRAMGDEFEERFQEQFDCMVNQLHITQNTAYPTFQRVVEELFSNGTNWGRVVALFGFGGAIAVQCVEKGMPQIVDNIVDWVSTYIDYTLEEWIRSQGGWQGFVDFYSRRHNNTDQDNPWDGSRVFKLGVLGALGAVALGAILTQRT
ncbi:hypothetical protein FSP39_019575 [Pinctada imbricata]|uniref:Apoptosis regulator Bcl-2 family BH4 domain-containing protein n=1 Tax=Pinctada imbricata TaxID=66713 RepID=A0AA89C729_PINIB|nr:hypothetical protein FSP39_019575 [Pinctada imbricata]